MDVAPDLRSLIVALYDAGAFVMEEKVLRSGVLSPFYVDLRVTISHPTLLAQIARALQQATAAVPHALLCGVPYTALPFATAMSLNTGVPMLMRRKERKTYGMAKEIEGDFKAADECLIVEDLVTTGGSVIEIANALRTHSLAVHHAVVLLDREQGACEKLAALGITLHAVTNLTTMVSVLRDADRLSAVDARTVLSFVAASRVAAPPPAPRSYEERARDARAPLASRLLSLMSSKRTNLAVAADVTTRAALLALADAAGPHIAVLKTHADIVGDWDARTGSELRALAERHNFLIFEDRKLADIGNTVVQQVSGGLHSIAEWADFVNAHALPGPGIVDGVRKVNEGRERALGLVLLAEMSSKGNLARLPGYKEAVVAMAEGDADFVFGFISMGRLKCKDADQFVFMTPGVKMAAGGDALGQQYNTPEAVVGEKGSDMIIVGRGIYEAVDPAVAAKEFRDAGWNAYLKRLGQ